MPSYTLPKRTALTVALVAAFAMAGSPAMAKDVTDADILNDAKTTDDVVRFGLGPQGQRFSPATQIDTKTVKDLVPVLSLIHI